MRHRRAGLKLNRTSSHRNAMFRNMVTSLFKHERITTTDTKAKEIRRWADNLITLAKRGDLHARRQALAIVREKAVVHKLFSEATEKFGAASGGYTRVVHLGRRPGDAAPISLVELISSTPDRKRKTGKKKKSSTPRKAAVAATEAAVDETTASPAAAAEAAPKEVGTEKRGEPEPEKSEKSE